jgi:hypothetical protein
MPLLFRRACGTQHEADKLVIADGFASSITAYTATFTRLLSQPDIHEAREQTSPLTDSSFVLTCN